MKLTPGPVASTFFTMSLIFAALLVGCGPEDTKEFRSAAAISKSLHRGGSLKISANAYETTISFGVIRCEGCGNPWMGDISRPAGVITIPQTEPSAYELSQLSEVGTRVVAVSSSDDTSYIFTKNPASHGSEIMVWEKSGAQWEPRKATGLNSPEIEFTSGNSGRFFAGYPNSTGGYNIAAFNKSGEVTYNNVGVATATVSGSEIVTSALSLASGGMFAALGMLGETTEMRAFLIPSCEGCEPQLVAEADNALPEAVWSNDTTLKVLGHTSGGKIAQLIKTIDGRTLTSAGPDLPTDGCWAMAYGSDGAAYAMSTVRDKLEVVLYTNPGDRFAQVGPSYSTPRENLAVAPLEQPKHCGLSIDAQGNAHMAVVGRITNNGSDVVEYIKFSPEGELRASIQIPVN